MTFALYKTQKVVLVKHRQNSYSCTLFQEASTTEAAK